VKILCKRCKKTVAFGVGKLVNIKRQDDNISVVGEDYSILVTCPRHCGYQTDIIVSAGKISEEKLLIDKEGENEETIQPEKPEENNNNEEPASTEKSSESKTKEDN
jgi:hypothetical protein